MSSISLRGLMDQIISDIWAFFWLHFRADYWRMLTISNFRVAFRLVISSNHYWNYGSLKRSAWASWVRSCRIFWFFPRSLPSPFPPLFARRILGRLIFINLLLHMFRDEFWLMPNLWRGVWICSSKLRFRERTYRCLQLLLFVALNLEENFFILLFLLITISLLGFVVWVWYKPSRPWFTGRALVFWLRLKSNFVELIIVAVVVWSEAPSKILVSGTRLRSWSMLIVSCAWVWI